VKDVARVAGVSVPTVSRVLNGSVPVSESKRDAVHAAIKTLGYRANGAARSLVTGTQRMVGLLTSNTSHYGYAQTIRGVEEAARQAGYVVVITVVESDEASTVQLALDLMLTSALAGLIVLDYDLPGQAVVAALPATLPVVACTAGEMSGSVINASLDDYHGARRATEHLLSLGHQVVSYVAIPPSGRPSGRMAGWAETLQEAGLPRPVFQANGWTPDEGYRCGRELAQLPGATAVLCGNDELALGLMHGLADAGKAVPADVSVVGFDGQPFGAHLNPPLTTVAQDFVALGRHAFGLLDSLIEASPAPVGEVPKPELIIRQSTGPASLP
jgi:DNA-binding LacI/PurR family transcriptional regulator